MRLAGAAAAFLAAWSLEAMPPRPRVPARPAAFSSPASMLSTDELKFGDNDNLAALICNLAGADLLVLLTDIDGLYDQDPLEHPGAELVPLVESIDAGLEKAAGRAGTLGRGGMASKLQAAKKAAPVGLPPSSPTASPPVSWTKSSRPKKWYSVPAPDPEAQEPPELAGLQRHPPGGHPGGPGGLRRLDPPPPEPAARRHRGGLRRFGKGAPVQLVDPEGHPFAMGLTNYSAREINRIKGRQTQEIAQTLGRPQRLRRSHPPG